MGVSLYVSSKTYNPSNSPPFTNPALSVPNPPSTSTSTSTLVTVTDDGGDADLVAGVAVDVDVERGDRGDRNALSPLPLVCVRVFRFLDGDIDTEDLSTRIRFCCLSSPVDRGLRSEEHTSELQSQ